MSRKSLRIAGVEPNVRRSFRLAGLDPLEDPVKFQDSPKKETDVSEIYRRANEAAARYEEKYYNSYEHLLYV